MLDKGTLELVDMMPHPLSHETPDMAVVNSARISFMSGSKGDAADKKLLFYMMRNMHTSPFEQVVFKFRVRAPLITYWQWVRHRTFHYQSINSQSGRYTPFEEDHFYVPDVWRKQSSSNKQGSEGQVSADIGGELTRAMNAHIERSMALYREALLAGVAKEQARLFLPGFSAYYSWIVSVDAWNLLSFLRQRMADDAQHEIRVYAEAMYNHFMKPLMPWTCEAAELYLFTKTS